MKILQVIPSLAPASGGPANAVLGLSLALAREGQEVTIFTTDADVKKRLNVPLGTPVNIQNIKVIYFPTQYLESYKISLPLFKALKDRISHFDILHIHSLFQFSTLAASYLCRKYHKSYIISPHGHLDPFGLKRRSLYKGLYMWLLEHKNLKGAKALHFTTDEERRLAGRPGIKTPNFVIPLGIDLEEFKIPPEYGAFRLRYPELKDKKIILFLSRINFKKGLDILIKAFAILARENKDAHLVIAGPDNEGYSKKVRVWLKKEGVSEKATFTGMLLGKDKLAAFRDSNVFVLPSYSENFGLSVVEAMACGVPVVISNKVGIYREVNENKAGVVVECNETSIYEGIKLILDNRSFAEELVFRGRKIVEEYYDIDKVADRTIKTYKEILKENRYIEYERIDKSETRAHRYIVPAIFKVIRNLDLKFDAKILDVGCGRGNLINKLYKYGFVNIWGFDISNTDICLAKKDFPEIRDRLFKYNAFEKKMPNTIPQAYNLIISMEVIEHLYSPESFLKNIYSWLDKSGYLIITTPYHGYCKNLILSLTNNFDRHFNPLEEGGHIKFFSKDSLSTLLYKQGFEIIRFMGVERIPYIWKSMIFLAKKIG